MGNSNDKLGGSSTAEEAAKGINLSNKNIIITGCNTGIGKETARVLAKHGGNIIMACRNEEKANVAKQEIIKSLTSKDPKKEEKEKENNINAEDLEKRLVFMKLDLGSLAAVREFAKAYTKKYTSLEDLVCNAGVYATVKLPSPLPFSRLNLYPPPPPHGAQNRSRLPFCFAPSHAHAKT